MTKNKFNLNTASASEIASILGIPTKKAQIIFDWIYWHGPLDAKKLEGFEYWNKKRVGQEIFGLLRSHTFLGPGPDISDINKVSGSWLSRIKGFNKELANEIIIRRPFRSWDDLAEVPGIGPAKLKAIKEIATITISSQQEIKNESDSIPEEKVSSQGKNTMEKNIVTSQDKPGKTESLKPKDKPNPKPIKINVIGVDNILEFDLSRPKDPTILFGSGSKRPENPDIEGKINIQSMLFSPDGKLAVASMNTINDAGKLAVIDLTDIKKVPEIFSPFPFPDLGIIPICWHPDNQQILLKLMFWDEGINLLVMFNLVTGKCRLINIAGDLEVSGIGPRTISILSGEILYYPRPISDCFYKLEYKPMPQMISHSSIQSSLPDRHFLTGIGYSLSQGDKPDHMIFITTIVPVGWDGSNSGFVLFNPKMDENNPPQLKVWRLGTSNYFGNGTSPNFEVQPDPNTTPAQFIDTIEPNTIFRFDVDGSFHKIHLKDLPTFPGIQTRIYFSRDSTKIALLGFMGTWGKEWAHLYNQQPPTVDDPNDPRIYLVDAGLADQKVKVLDLKDRMWEIQNILPGEEAHIWYGIGKLRRPGLDWETTFVKDPSWDLVRIDMNADTLSHITNYSQYDPRPFY